MPKTQEDLEGYLSKLERRFERLEDGTYLVAGAPNQPPVAVRFAPPVIVARVEIGPLPPAGASHETELYRKLLELNSSDLLHAAYGIDDCFIVLDAALE